MARAKMRLRRINTRKIYRAANADTVRRLLPQQQSQRCNPVQIISDESCPISRDLIKITRKEILEAIEALIKTQDERRSTDPEPGINELLDGLIKEVLKRDARRFRFIRRRKLNAFSARRPRYKRRINLRSRFSEKRFAEWYREGPPNDKEICHTLRTAA